jgi:hypothetical protein
MDREQVMWMLSVASNAPIANVLEARHKANVMLNLLAELEKLNEQQSAEETPDGKHP